MVQSSLSFEIVMYLHMYYFKMFTACEIVLYLFKITHLPYSFHAIVTDLLIFTFLYAIESSRINVGRKGNFTGRTKLVVMSLLMVIPSIVGVAYIMFLQLKVLRLEVILCYVQLTMQILELLLGLLYICAYRIKKY